MTRKEILTEAEKCVCTDREQTYGNPENNFSKISDLWNAYKPCNITAHDVGIMLGLLKIGRIASGQANADNYIDLAGYAACAGELATEVSFEPTALERLQREHNDLRNFACNLCGRYKYEHTGACKSCKWQKKAEGEQ